MLKSVRILLILMAILTLLAGIALLWNQRHADYLDVNFLGRINANYSLLIYAILILGGFATVTLFPRVSLILKSIGYVSLSCAIILFATSAVFTTPFTRQDALFYHFDQLIGFHQAAFMEWVHQHHWLTLYLEMCYFLLIQIALLVPIVLAVLNNQKGMYRFLMALILTTLFGFAIYYFSPTTAPVSQLYSPYFTALEHYDLRQFIALHHHSRLLHYDSGIIGFPSFHVIWSLLIVYGFWRYRTIRIIALIFSLSVMVATLSSGWHYLADVLGAIAVVAVTVLILYALEKKSQNALS